MASTIRDVALMAGVSISTVSRVLNNTCSVAEDKRKRVETAAAHLGYTPNPAARSLLNRQMGGLGILLPYVSGEFFSEFLGGMDETAKNNDFFLLISTSHHKPAEWRASVQSVYKRVDGLIVMAPQSTPGQLDLRTEVPTVFVNTPVPAHTPVDVLNFDNLSGTYEATRHLLSLGHRSFCYVRGPRQAHDALARERGFRNAMNEAGIADFTVVDGGYDQADGHAAGQAIAAREHRPTAVLAANDYCALGVLSALKGAGLRVPEDISLVGFDDVASSRFSLPPLSTVRVPIREIGVRAVELLTKRIRSNEDHPAENISLPVTLVVRESTAPPATR